MQIVVGVVVVAVIAAVTVFFSNQSADTDIVVQPTEERAIEPETTEGPEREEEDTDTPPQDDSDIVDSPADVSVSGDIEVSAPAVEANVFTNGTYTAEASYFTPRRTQHDMDISLTVEDDIVTAATISYDGGSAATPSHTRFDDAYRAEVVGVPLNDINLSRTGGASLTSDAFNEALVDIRAQAS